MMLESFSAPSVLGRSLRVLAANAGAFAVIFALAYAPVVVLAVLSVGTLGIPGTSMAALFGAILTLMTLLAAGGVTHAVMRTLDGQRPGFADALSGGLRGFWRAIPSGAATWLVVSHPAVLVFFVPFVVMMAITPFGAWLLFVGLSVLLTVPALASMFWLAGPVAAVERLGVRRSFGRSRHLTQGAKGTVFALLLVLVGAGLAATFIAVGMGGLWAGLGMAAFFGAWTAAASAVAYFDLRAIHG